MTEFNEIFRKIAPEEMGNVFKYIGKDWMLFTVKDKKNGRVNAMTASWGAMGVLWNKNVCVCFVRPQRHTHELLEEEDTFSVAVLPEKYRGALKLCGSESGRDTDKLAKCGLSVTDIKGTAVIAEADLAIVCKKLYVDELKEESFIEPELLSFYKEKDYHTFYVCEIKEAYKRK